MSADNGIYILQTKGRKSKFEYRVCHTQAIENLQWDDQAKSETSDRKVWINNARQIWKGCEVFCSHEEANKEAKKIYDDIMQSELPIVEYGICTINHLKEFFFLSDQEYYDQRFGQW